MYATIRRHEGGASTDELARAAHALATRLGAVPGFVACLLLETHVGGHASVCIFEDQASLATADELVSAWSAVGHPAHRAEPPQYITGEVIAQKGL